MKNILNKLNLIMSEVQNMPKDKVNSMQNYKYLSETTVKEKMRGLFVQYKVVPFFSSEEKEFIQIGVTKSGTPNWLTKVRVTYKFMDAESGESVEGFYDSTGADTQDKGVFKAVTGAVKNILMQDFLIPTGDDPEKDEPQTKAKATVKPESKPKGDWEPQVYTRTIEKENANCSYSTGPQRWTAADQKKLLASGKFGIKTIVKKNGNKIYQLGAEGMEWDWLNTNFVDYLADRFGEKNQLATAQETFNQPTT